MSFLSFSLVSYFLNIRSFHPFFLYSLSLSHVSLRVTLSPLFLPLSPLTRPSTARPPLPQTLLPPPRPRCLYLSLASFHSLPDIPISCRLPSKRKASEELDGPNDSVSSSSKDFEAGRVTCEACGDSVSYRDERTGAFTTKHWDAHKLGWSVHLPPHIPRLPRFFPLSPAASSTSPAPEPPKSQARPSGPSTEPKSRPNANVSGPPSKRRRAKRSEEERIQYLRSDPYVAQFDAYRVLCASCDKWIRLRPNSTFCSIPWDAHRKSCLARKGCVIRPTLPIFVSYILRVP